MNWGKPLLPPLQWDIIKTSLQSSRLLVAGFLLTTIAASGCTVAGPLLFSRAVARLSSAPPRYTLSLLLLFAVTAALARYLQDVKVVLSSRLELRREAAPCHRPCTDRKAPAVAPRRGQFRTGRADRARNLRRTSATHVGYDDHSNHASPGRDKST